MNIRCKCEWCESWNQGSEPWKLSCHPSTSKEQIDEYQKQWDKIYAKLNNDRRVLENYSKEELLVMCTELLTCSGEFNSEPVHALCLAVKELLENK